MNTQLIADAVRNSRGKAEERPFGTGFSRSGSAAWSTPRSGKTRKPISPRFDCRSARPSSPSPPADATRCPISRRSRRRSTRSISTRRICRCSSSSSRAFARSPATPNSGSSSARRPRPPTPALYRDRLRPVLDAERAPTGTSAISSAVRAMPISPTGSIATACSAASSALPMCWRNWRGSILRRC